MVLLVVIGCVLSVSAAPARQSENLLINGDGDAARQIAAALAGASSGAMAGAQPDGSYIPAASTLQASGLPSPSIHTEMGNAQRNAVPALVLDAAGVYHKAGQVGQTGVAPSTPKQVVDALTPGISTDDVTAQIAAAMSGTVTSINSGSLFSKKADNSIDNVLVQDDRRVPVYEADPLDDPIAYTRSVFGMEKQSIMAGRDGGPLDEDVSDRTLPRAPAGIAATLQLFGMGTGTFTAFERYRVRAALGAAIGPALCMFFKSQGLTTGEHNRAHCDLGGKGFDIQIEHTRGPVRQAYSAKLYIPMHDSISNATKNGISHHRESERLANLLQAGALSNSSAAHMDKSELEHFRAALERFRVLKEPAYEVSFRIVFGFCNKEIERTLQVLPQLVLEQIDDGKMFRLLSDLQLNAIGVLDHPHVSSCRPLIKLSLPEGIMMKDSMAHCYYDGRRVRVSHLPKKIGRIDVGGLGREWREGVAKEHNFFCKHYVDHLGFHRCACKSWHLPGDANVTTTTVAPAHRHDAHNNNRHNNASAPEATKKHTATATPATPVTPMPTPAPNDVIDEWWQVDKGVKTRATLCRMSNWGKWHACSKDCGGGVHSRHRAIMWRGPEVDLHECPPTMQERSCNVASCPWKKATLKCSMSPWGDWSACSASCGGGTQSRRRKVLWQPTTPHNGTCPHETEYVTCNMDSCPRPHIFMRGKAELYLPLHIAPADKYVDAGAICSDESDGESGGAGTIQYHVTVSQAPPVDVHTPGTYRVYYDCKNKDGIRAVQLVRTVYVGDCGAGGKTCGWPKRAIDCILAPFGAWKPCSRTCGGGAQLRDIALARAPQNGGQTCGDYRKKYIKHSQWSRPCNNFKCPNTTHTGSQYNAFRHKEPLDEANPLTAKQQAKLFKPTTQFPGYKLLKEKLLHSQTPAPTPSPTPRPTFGTRAPTPMVADHSTLTMRNGCIYSGWGTYATCSKSCGGGTKTRFRTMIGKTETATAKKCDYLKQEHLCNIEPCDSNWSTNDRKARVEMTLVLPRELPRGAHGAETIVGARKDSFRTALGKALSVRAVQVAFDTVSRTLVSTGILAHCIISIRELHKLDAYANMVKRGSFEGLVVQGLAQSGFIVSEVKDVHAVVETSAPTPAPRACVLSDWGAWSECTKSCMAGLQHRTRKVLVQPTAGKACLSRWEYQTCNDKPCPPVTQQLDDGAAAHNAGVPYQVSESAPPVIAAESSFLRKAENVPQPDIVPVETDKLPAPLEPLAPSATP